MPATAPRAIASLRRNVADHRQIAEAVADAYVQGHVPDFAAFQQTPARKVDLPTYPFEHRQYWFRDDREPAGEERAAAGPRTDSVRLLEDGHIAELATLLGGSGERPTGHEGSDRACRTTQPAARRAVDVGRPLRDPLGQVSQPALRRRHPARSSAGFSSATHSPALQPLVDAITARGQRHRFVDAADLRRRRGRARRGAARRCRRRSGAAHPARRGARLRTTRAVDAIAAADATSSPQRHAASLQGRDVGRPSRADLGADPRRTARHRHRRRRAGTDRAVGFRPGRGAGASAGVGRPGRPADRCHR